MTLSGRGHDGTIDPGGPPPSARGVAARCAGLTLLLLPGGVLLGIGLAVASNAVPVHAPPSFKIVLSAIVGLAVMMCASAAWGRWLGRRTGCRRPSAMGKAAALSFAPTVILIGVGLTYLEGVVLQLSGRPDVPIHIVFGILFVPAAFLVAGITAFAVGTTIGSGRSALGLAVRTGLAAAGAFLGVDVFMDLIGWRVGAPGAEERATMLTVMMLGILAASLAGGAMLSALLSSRKRRAEGRPSDEDIVAAASHSSEQSSVSPRPTAT